MDQTTRMKSSLYQLLRNNQRIARGSIEKLMKRIPRGCQLKIGKSIKQQFDQFQWHSQTGDIYVIEKVSETKPIL